LLKLLTDKERKRMKKETLVLFLVMLAEQGTKKGMNSEKRKGKRKN